MLTFVLPSKVDLFVCFIRCKRFWKQCTTFFKRRGSTASPVESRCLSIAHFFHEYQHLDGFEGQLSRDARSDFAVETESFISHEDIPLLFRMIMSTVVQTDMFLDKIDDLFKHDLFEEDPDETFVVEVEDELVSFQSLSVACPLLSGHLDEDSSSPIQIQRFCRNAIFLFFEFLNRGYEHIDSQYADAVLHTLVSIHKFQTACGSLVEVLFQYLEPKMTMNSFIPSFPVSGEILEHGLKLLSYQLPPFLRTILFTDNVYSLASENKFDLFQAILQPDISTASSREVLELSRQFAAEIVEPFRTSSAGLPQQVSACIHRFLLHQEERFRPFSSHTSSNIPQEMNTGNEPLMGIDIVPSNSSASTETIGRNRQEDKNDQTRMDDGLTYTPIITTSRISSSEVISHPTSRSLSITSRSILDPAPSTVASISKSSSPTILDLTTTNSIPHNLHRTSTIASNPTPFQSSLVCTTSFSSQSLTSPISTVASVLNPSSQSHSDTGLQPVRRPGRPPKKLNRIISPQTTSQTVSSVSPQPVRKPGRSPKKSNRIASSQAVSSVPPQPVGRRGRPPKKFNRITSPQTTSQTVSSVSPQPVGRRGRPPKKLNRIASSQTVSSVPPQPVRRPGRPPKNLNRQNFSSSMSTLATGRSHNQPLPLLPISAHVSPEKTNIEEFERSESSPVEENSTNRLYPLPRSLRSSGHHASYENTDTSSLATNSQGGFRAGYSSISSIPPNALVIEIDSSRDVRSVQREDIDELAPSETHTSEVEALTNKTLRETLRNEIEENVDTKFEEEDDANESESDLEDTSENEEDSSEEDEEDDTESDDSDFTEESTEDSDEDARPRKQPRRRGRPPRHSQPVSASRDPHLKRASSRFQSSL